jgi:cysteine desulfurase/selenocysteine lyase
MNIHFAGGELYKKDFPIFGNNPELIYLDSAASAQKPKCVIDAVSNFYENDYANIHRGLYSLSDRSTQLFEEARKTVAEFLKAESPDQIVFTKNATEAINLVKYAWAEQHLNAGDTVLITIMEHHANYVPWFDLAQKKGINLRVVELNSDEYVTAEEVIAQIDDTVKLVAITQMSNALGVKLDANRVVTHARNLGIKTLVDASQSVAHSPMDVIEIGADFFVFSGHKLYGPSGVGVLCLSKDAMDFMPAFLMGGDMIKSVSLTEVLYADAPARFEAGTPNIEGVIGLAAAIKYLSKIGMDWIELNDSTLVDYALDKLLELDEMVRVLGPQTKGLRGSAVSFEMKGVHAHDVAQILADNGVCVRAGHHCAQPLMQALGASSSVRFSFGLYNSTKDIEKAIEVLKTVPSIFKR